MKSRTIKVYKKWLEKATAEQVKFVDSVYKLCERNYEAGGDWVVEAMTPQEITEQFKSLDDAKSYCGIVVEQATNARYGDDEDPELDNLRRFEEDWED